MLLVFVLIFYLYLLLSDKHNRQTSIVVFYFCLEALNLMPNNHQQLAFLMWSCHSSIQMQRWYCQKMKFQIFKKTDAYILKNHRNIIENYIPLMLIAHLKLIFYWNSVS
jgi:hypothetical protein